MGWRGAIGCVNGRAWGECIIFWENGCLFSYDKGMSKEHSEPVTVGRYPTEFEAVLTKNMLTEAGIPAQVVGAMTAAFRAETPGFVKVMVPGEFEERALELLIEQTNEVQERDAEAGEEEEEEEEG